MQSSRVQKSANCVPRDSYASREILGEKRYGRLDQRNTALAGSIATTPRLAAGSNSNQGAKLKSWPPKRLPRRARQSADVFAALARWLGVQATDLIANSVRKDQMARWIGEGATPLSGKPASTMVGR